MTDTPSADAAPNSADSAAEEKTGTDYSETLFLPKTDFPMRAGLPKREPEFVARWDKMDLYGKLREAGKGRPRYTLHDGPPYANGNIHIGTGLNKILKDVVTRSMQMAGYESNYVPGWDCHGLPIEWKIEEQYRAKGRDKDAVPVNEFRAECREFAKGWVKVQTEEFKRLGVIGDFKNPYTTMAFDAEAVIAQELMKFAASGQLYRGSKPVMWSVVEKTALAEAEVEYHDYESDTVWVKFPVRADPTISSTDLDSASVVIWTTTPWTIPGNRAISYSHSIAYGLFEVTEEAELPDGARPWAKKGDTYILAKNLADTVFSAARVPEGGWKPVRDVTATEVAGTTCAHPLAGHNDYYKFDVPLLNGDHVTAEDGTGFVHTAPGHGREDFEIWMDKRSYLESRGINSAIPYTVDENGAFTADAPGFEGARVINDKGKKGDANNAVIKALVEAGNLIARNRLKHQYPHSWRSKKPVIFRNTPQWFVYMDRDIDPPDTTSARQGGKRDGAPAGQAAPAEASGTSQTAVSENKTLRARALQAIADTRFVPAAGQNRLRGMIESRPDWVLSRQRAWGVPICVFVNAAGQVLNDAAVNARIIDAFRTEGADAWFAEGAKQRFLADAVTNPADNPDNWDLVTDILDVWFDSGCTHAFVMEKRADLASNRIIDGGNDTVLYLEGSDQHRGWFHSSLLESCGTRGRAPYDAVLTHGFVMAEDGRKMSKSLGNQTFPQDIIKTSGADILRLWVVSSDYTEDLRIGPEIIKTNIDAYRKLRNTMRWMLGTLGHLDADNAGEKIDPAAMPELEQLMLSELARLDGVVRQAYLDFDYKRIFAALFNFMTVDLSAFYFDIRKDALYCDPASSPTRRAALSVIDRLFDSLVRWLAPMLPFTMEEAWMNRHGEEACVHLQQFADIPADWRNETLEDRWKAIRRVRSAITGALEIERREKRIGSSLEAAPTVFVADEAVRDLLAGMDLAEIAITSQANVEAGEGPADAFRLADVTGVAVVSARAAGKRCARSWKFADDIGADPDYPDITARDARAMREWAARQPA